MICNHNNYDKLGLNKNASLINLVIVLHMEQLMDPYWPVPEFLEFFFNLGGNLILENFS